MDCTASNKGRSWVTSCRLPPVSVTATGVPCRSTIAARGRDERRLRICLTCGHAGCSDSAPGAHATAHFESSGHPLVRSAERGRQWAWCYIDEVFLEPASYARR
ncbi:UBP-type zinc finger domain-containing protein [Streptomyces althioticus]|uniref:UBP-type zinc finger domain-containing protein n=1 Tax=Streptomyces althioticus TaxID=83380 RepID=UPI0033D33CD6